MKKILSLAVAVFMSLTVFYSFAADNDTQPLGSYWFVGAKGGIQIVPTDFNHSKLITPAVGVQFGRFFTPEVGLRLDAQAWKSRGGLKSLDGTYDFKYVTGDIDLLLNLTNIFSKNKYHCFNTYFIAGVGAAYAWDNDDLTSAVKRLGSNLAEKNVNAWDDHRWSHNLRLGLACDYNFTRNWAVNLEVDANSLSDRFNSKINNNCDWQLTAMAGVTFKWGHPAKKAAPAPAPEPEPAPAPVPVAEPEPAPEPAPAPVVVPEPAPAPRVAEEAKFNFFYDINETTVSAKNDAEVARMNEWLKNHKVANASVTGYADAGTGNSRINAKLAQQRADNVTDMLAKKYGVAEGNIDTNSCGDKVQPYQENDKNRVVQIVLTEDIK
jgi:outer membrane protein OmpA-like peptidoglycan-associated protein